MVLNLVHWTKGIKSDSDIFIIPSKSGSVKDLQDNNYTFEHPHPEIKVKIINKKIEAFGADIYVSYRKIKGVKNLLIFNTENIGSEESYNFLGIWNRLNVKQKSGYYQYEDKKLVCIPKTTKVFDPLEVLLDKFRVKKSISYPKIELEKGVNYINGPNRCGKTLYLKSLLKSEHQTVKDFLFLSNVFTEKTKAGTDSTVSKYIIDTDFHETLKNVKKEILSVKEKLDYLEGIKNVNTDKFIKNIPTEELQLILCINKKIDKSREIKQEKLSKYKKILETSGKQYKHDKYSDITIDSKPKKGVFNKEVYTFLLKCWEKRDLLSEKRYKEVEKEYLLSEYFLSIKHPDDFNVLLHSEIQSRKILNDTDDNRLKEYYDQLISLKAKLNGKEYQKIACEDFNIFFEEYYKKVYFDIFGDNKHSKGLSGFEKTIKEIAYRVAICKYKDVKLSCFLIDEDLDKTYDKQKVESILKICSEVFDSVYYVTHIHTIGKHLNKLF